MTTNITINDVIDILDAAHKCLTLRQISNRLGCPISEVSGVISEHNREDRYDYADVRGNTLSDGRVVYSVRRP